MTGQLLGFQEILYLQHWREGDLNIADWKIFEVLIQSMEWGTLYPTRDAT